MRLKNMFLIMLRGLLVSSVLTSASIADTGGNPNIKGDLVGVIEYRDYKEDVWRGEDRFRLSIHPDGSKTMRVVTRIDEQLILRDAVTRVSKDYLPLDVYVSHWLDGEHRGTGFFWSKDGRMNSKINAPNGIISQQLDVGDKFSVATRPQATFGWHVGHYDFEKGGEQLSTIFVVDRLGSSVGSISANLHHYYIRLLDSGPLEVGAGKFDAWHFELVDKKDRAHRYDVWVEKENLITLKLIHEKYHRVYELVELRQTY